MQKRNLERYHKILLEPCGLVELSDDWTDEDKAGASTDWNEETTLVQWGIGGSELVFLELPDGGKIVIHQGDPPAYRGYRAKDRLCHVIRPNLTLLPLAPSLGVKNASPTGFEWGYSGSGPSQLALALLLDHCGDRADLLPLAQEFKRSFVSGWSDGWEITPADIAEFLAAQ